MDHYQEKKKPVVIPAIPKNLASNAIVLRNRKAIILSLSRKAMG
jgi:hypothetical protein